MHHRYPCGGLGRRAFLKAGVMGASVPLVGGARLVTAGQDAAASKVVAAAGEGVGLPGPYPGRVVEVKNPAMIRNDVRNAEAVKTALDAGMKRLTGADDSTQAWRRFFEPGDVVGVKMNPVGMPLANSSNELMLAVIEGLKAAGVKTSDIIVFERYRDMFIEAKMNEAVPEGIAWTGLTAWSDDSQLEIEGPAGSDPLSGYDPDVFMTMELVHDGQDPKDDRTRRSHLGKLITRRVNKVVLLPVLKDHGSGGVTGALKNMSHGLVNNVARSHSNPHSNVCNQFIPQVVSHPVIRQKCVLQVMDGIKGVYQGGPFGKNPEWTWEQNSLYLATDPVAMDHLLWRTIDAKRKEKGLPPVGSVGKLGLDAEREGFDMRQPQHIALAGHLGLGVFDWEKILHEVVKIDPTV